MACLALPYPTVPDIYFSMSTITIYRCYDSHVHWAYTGEKLSELNLRELSGPSDIRKLQIEKTHFRGAWLCGFGWDETKWTHPKLPTRFDLDELFPENPVYFTRADGHAAWINTCALRLLGYFDFPKKYEKMILRDSRGEPTGVVIESAAIDISFQLPAVTDEEMETYLLKAMKLFNRSGYTHIRDMTGNYQTWQCARQLEKNKQLSLFVDMNFIAESLPDLTRAISEAKKAKLDKSKYLRVAGIKIFLDGSLGSESAFLTKDYLTSQQRGLTLFSREDLFEVIHQVWQEGLPLAVHSIGDAASELLAVTAMDVTKSGVHGELHVEHAQVMRPETIGKFKSLNATIHMQPIHFLTDRKWLRQKLGELYTLAFPWAQIEAMGLNLQFGSDSPIEESSLLKIPEALSLAKDEGIQSIVANFSAYCSHPDPHWGAGAYTVLDSTPRIVIPE